MRTLQDGTLALKCRAREDLAAMNNAYLVVDNAQVSCVNDPHQAVTQVKVRGRWDGRLRDEVSRVLRACVAEGCQVVVVDLAQLEDPAGESASTWQTMSRYAMENDSPTALIVCAAAPVLRQHLSAGTAGQRAAVVLVDTVDAALAAVPYPNGGVRHQHMSLPPGHSSIVLARTMAGDACLTFDLAHLVHPVRLIMSELVVNAVAHAGTDIDVRVSVRGRMLHVAVQDRSSRPPRLLDIGPWRPGELLEQPGTGLRVVAAAATSWGSFPCPEGKVVWAALATRPGPTP